jgi:hypothetical protein
VEPALQLVLEVELRRERAAGLEARLQEPLQALDQSLGLAVARVEDAAAHPELAAEGRELVRGPAAPRV